MALYK